MESQELHRFKTIILELYKSFPQGLFGEEIIKMAIITEEMREELVNKGILYKTKLGDKNYYTLGANGLNLVSSWKMEELTDETKRLNQWVLILSVIVVFLTIIQILLIAKT